MTEEPTKAAKDLARDLITNYPDVAKEINKCGKALENAISYTVARDAVVAATLAISTLPESYPKDKMIDKFTELYKKSSLDGEGELWILD